MAHDGCTNTREQRMVCLAVEGGAGMDGMSEARRARGVQPSVSGAALART